MESKAILRPVRFQSENVSDPAAVQGFENLASLSVLKVPKPINILPEISSHPLTQVPFSPIDKPVPEYWSLSTNEIVHRQRFQSIRER